MLSFSRKACVLALACLPGLLVAAGPTPLPRPFEDNMAERTRACTACHGDQGRAGPDGYYPRLAGKPAGYLHHQLRNFAEGRRHYGLMTRLVDPMSEAYMAEIAAHFASLHLPYPAPTPSNLPADRLARGKALVLQGDAARGLPACVQCHGERLAGVQPDVPGLLGLPLDYLNAQLGAWQTGQRKALAPDCMAEVVRRIPHEDIIAISGWLSSQPLPADTRPAPAPVRIQTDRAWRCGSAPALSGDTP
ncbi:MAG: c-type cytochrome [Limnohabitans sp.]